MNLRVALITGASSGIGRALAIEAVKRGFVVGLMARSADGLQETVRACTEILGDRSQSSKIHTTIGDVSIEADCKRFVDDAMAQWGKIDVLINNAGISMRGIFEDTDISVLQRLMDTNFWGTVYCTNMRYPLYWPTKVQLLVFLPLRVSKVCQREPDTAPVSLPCKAFWRVCDAKIWKPAYTY